MQLESFAGGSGVVAVQTILQQIAQSLAAQRAARLLEEFSTQFGVEAYGFEKLTIAVACKRGNTHSSDYFAEALFDRCPIPARTIGS